MSLLEEFADWVAYPVDVETYEGSGAWGESWAEPVSVNVWYEAKNQLVVTSDGNTVTSSSFLVADVADLAKFAENSRVTLSGMVPYRVLSVRSFPNVEDAHVEVYLT